MPETSKCLKEKFWGNEGVLDRVVISEQLEHCQKKGLLRLHPVVPKLRLHEAMALGLSE